jgi:hypothetical protein
MLTISIVKFDLDGLVLARVVMILVDIWPFGRDSVHRVQIEFLASAIGRQSDCNCQTCVAF